MTKANVAEAATIIVAILVVGVGSVGVTLLLTGNDNGTDNTAQVQSESTQQQPQIQMVSLDIEDQSPLLIQARQGDYIQFEPVDDSSHQIISSGDGEHAEDGFDSGVFNADQNFRMQVKDIGTFELQDTYNPDKKITIQAS